MLCLNTVAIKLPEILYKDYRGWQLVTKLHYAWHATQAHSSSQAKVTPCLAYCTQRLLPGQGYTMPGIPHTVAVTWSKLHYARYTVHSGGHLVKVTLCQVYRTQWRSPGQSYTMPGIPHTVAVTWSKLHYARYTTHSGGHLVKVTLCQVYRTQWRSPGQCYTMPGIPHTVAVTWSKLHYARYTAHSGGHLVKVHYARYTAHSGGHLVKITTSCLAYRIQQWSPTLDFTMPSTLNKLAVTLVLLFTKGCLITKIYLSCCGSR